MRLSATGLMAVGTSAVALALVLALIGWQLVRRRRQRRHAIREAPGRRLLVALASGERGAEQELLRLPERSWRAAEPTATRFIEKLRGESRDSLIRVFEGRGVAKRAMRQVRSRSAVRRASAAEVLGAMRRREALAPLCVLLDDPAPEVRVVAARALGRIGEMAAVGPLVASLDRAGPPQQVIAHALLGLGQEAERPMLDTLATTGPHARATVVEVLGLSRALRSVPALVELLWQDPVLEVRVRVVRALGRIGSRAALSPLLAATERGEATPLRTVAARALGDLGDPFAAPRLVELLSERVHQIAHNAAESLLELGEAGRAGLREAVGLGVEPAMGHAREALARDELRAERLRAAGVAAGAGGEL
ncbi:HEAT repeat protein [Saccharomonospora amisosensis]|uniref:HEAT repeat protein n=1 Tax=Saccharomonospora amisosensis TaxID=1128677 RepID=A0A7X5UMQ6_9PSEU|nr:HEAT repeat domain-containing protein [Saccharomonospora amisosensis]NIJ10850.1 HEAT repeat protein [Saccharomonospora amisosensis]